MKTKLLSTTFFSFFLFSINFSQTFDWAASLGGTTADNTNCVSVDKWGNVYSTGYFKGSVDFDPSPTNTAILSSGSSGIGIYIQKLDANGKFVWAKSMYSTGSMDIGYGIVVDDDGNIYTTGSFIGWVDFDPGVGTHQLNSVGYLSAYEGYNTFIQKLDSAGNFLWAKSFKGIDANTTCTNRANGIVLDSYGNPCVVGSFKGTVDFDPGSATNNLISAGGDDIYIAKLDTLGNFIWAKRIGANGADIGYGIAIDANDNFYATGSFTNTVDFDPNPSIDNLTSSGDSDVFIIKLGVNGNYVWSKSFGGIDWDYGYGIKVDLSGNIISTGSFQKTPDFDPGAATFSINAKGSDDVFIQKLDASGNFLWAKGYGASVASAHCIGNDVAFDINGNIYSIGSFEETVNFGSSTLGAFGQSDFFIHKLDALGNSLWVKSFGGSGKDVGRSIFVDGLGNIYSAGYFEGTVNFDPFVGISNLSSNGQTDCFVQKLNGSTVGINQNIDKSDFTIAPNPFNTKAILSLGDKFIGATIELIDMIGNKLQVYQANGNQLEIEKGSLPSGIYFIRLINDYGGVLVQKIVIQ